MLLGVVVQRTVLEEEAVEGEEGLEAPLDWLCRLGNLEVLNDLRRPCSSTHCDHSVSELD
jgi:hypothetical protein